MRLLSFAIFAFLSLGIHAQVKINEVVSNNTTLPDEDGDTPDWIELRNLGVSSVYMTNWSLSDDLSDPQKWMLPDNELSSNDYSFYWASGKNRSGNEIARTLINQGDLFNFFSPDQPLSTSWSSIEYDDSSWNSGNSGFGYADGDDNTSLPNGTISVFLRKKITIADASIISKLILDIDYDDGFVAYLNGIEIARANINGTPPNFNATTITDHEAQMYTGGIPDRFEILNPADFIQDGENVLAIQVHNISNTSSDFTAIPFLTGIYSEVTTEGIDPPAILDFSDLEAHTNFKLSSSGETLYLFDESIEIVDSLVLTYLSSDISYGLNISGDSYVYFKETTPNAINSPQSYLGIIQPKIQFSHPGGPTGTTNLVLSGNQPEEQIRYTTDLSQPTIDSELYTFPIFLNSKATIRAKIFREGFIESPVQSKSYLINIGSDLPILSVITDPDNFFDSDYGIYVLGDDYNGDFPYFGSNIWEEWERPVEVSLYNEDGSLETGFNAGAKIFGGYSRGNDQRSLSLFARSQYGDKKIEHQIFPDYSIDEFEAIVLRNSGNDWNRTHLRDRVLTSLMVGTGVDFQQNRPVSSYINGNYWGIYNIREKVNEHFISSKHQIETDEIDLLEFQGIAIHGEDIDYQMLINFIENNSLSSTENYQIVADQIDIENFSSYFAAQIYFNNNDWPGNNIKFWRPKNGKWRWILYDTDFGFGTWNPFDYQNNTLAFASDPFGPNWPNPPWSTLLFRKLLENTEFRNQFVNRYADFMNSRFLAENINTRIELAADQITTEMVDHKQRWGGNFNSWTIEISNMNLFANSRQAFAKNHIRQEFDLPAIRQVTIQNNTVARGYVQLNSLQITDAVWSGDYFQNVPIHMTAIARPGYVFSHWEGASSSDESYITHNLTSNETFIPVFQISTQAEKSVVINEINYKSSDEWDSGDWIEIHNPNNFELNISNWTIEDNDPSSNFVIPSNTTIPPTGFLVISRNLLKFNTIYPEIQNKIGELSFGLGTEDAIKIFNQFGELQDEVSYQSTTPWPEEANGTGATLELISPDLDNSIAENWKILHENGSAGVTNEAIVGITQPIVEDINIGVFPNPTSGLLRLSSSQGLQQIQEIFIQDVSGVILLEEDFESLEKKSMQIDISNYAPGVYFISAIIGGKLSSSRKVVKL